MKLEVTWTCDVEPQHNRIENADRMNLDNWTSEYVSIGGYFGPYNPQMFAAAPDMYQSIGMILEAAESRDIDAVHYIARAALAKAGGK